MLEGEGDLWVIYVPVCRYVNLPVLCTHNDGDSVSDKDVGGDKQQLGWLAFVMLRCGGGHR